MTLAQDIQREISTAAIQNLNFTVEGRAVAPAIYAPVRSKIQSGDITARKVGQGEDVAGAYHYGDNRFDMRFSAVDGDPFKGALVVHEATHAAFDIINQPMPVKVSEALAYLAQAVYFWHANRAQLEGGGTVSFGAPLSTAWEVSEPARDGEHIFTAEELAPLYAAIDADPLYHGRGGDDEAIDGV